MGEDLEASMGNRRACDMCGRSSPDVRLSREHVFPQVLRDTVADSEHHTYTSGTNPGVSGMEFTEHARPMNLMDVTVRSICTDCNGGWMSKLEERAAPTLKGLIAGESHVGAAESDIVRLWAAKTAAVIQMAVARGSEAPVDAKDRLKISEGTVPDAWVVNLTRLDASWRHHQHRGHFPVECRRVVEGVESIERYHLTMIEIGQMLLTVVGGPPDSDVSGDVCLHAVRHLWEVVPAIAPLGGGEDAELITWHLPSERILQELALRFVRYMRLEPG